MEGPKRRLENYVEEFRLACIRIHPSKKPSIYEAYSSSLSFILLGRGMRARYEHANFFESTIGEKIRGCVDGGSPGY